MLIDFDVQTLSELYEVAEWYRLDADEYVRRAVKRALDDVADNINPQLPCWLGRHVKH